VTGKTLADVLAAEGTLSFDDLLPILEDVLDALIELHASGTVYGGLAPESVLIHEEGERLRGALLSPERAHGAAECRAPEQRDATTEADPRADLFAVGAIAFRALTGGWPFDESFSAEAATLSAVTDEQWPTPLERWVSSLLARERRYRLPNAELALDALTVMSRRVAATSRPPPE
jgi:serine/threonine protein kinase